MAKQKGPQFISGTVGDLTYYKLNGRYYVRKKSSLSRKRVKRSPRFRRTMEYAGLLGQASKLAAEIYRSLPKEQRHVDRYREWTGQAMQLLKEGLEVEEVKVRLSGGKVGAEVRKVEVGDCFALRACKDGEDERGDRQRRLLRPGCPQEPCGPRNDGDGRARSDGDGRARRDGDGGTRSDGKRAPRPAPVRKYVPVFCIVRPVGRRRKRMAAGGRRAAGDCFGLRPRNDAGGAARGDGQGVARYEGGGVTGHRKGRQNALPVVRHASSSSPGSG